MKKSIVGFVVCVLGLAACNVEHYDDCDGDWSDSGGKPSISGPGPSASSGKASNDSGGAAGSSSGAGAAPGGVGGKDSEAGGTGPVVVPPRHCEQESNCQPGYNCDLDTQQCLPSDEETCSELKTEAACSHRSDCTPIYAGLNCSCGQDCECHGGEPGCVCESFELFACQDAPQPQ